MAAGQHFQKAFRIDVFPTVGPAAHIGGSGHIGHNQGAFRGIELAAQTDNRTQRTEKALCTVQRQCAGSRPDSTAAIRCPGNIRQDGTGRIHTLGKGFAQLAE